MATDALAVPDLAGVVVGWRAWRVVQRPGGPELVAPVQGTRWSPGRATHARCTSGRHDPGAVPAEGCRCGLYAVADPLGVVGHDGPGAVLGCVALYGDLLEGTQGWRASRGVPRLLLAGPDVDEATCTRLAARYGVPVRRSATSLRALAAGLSERRDRADALRDAVRAAADGTESPVDLVDGVLHELSSGPGRAGRPTALLLVLAAAVVMWLLTAATLVLAAA
ncbi:hypothetical protein EV188_104488 [Actinomycetospora succinea]|uniref:Uncharacterized protein n=1 Tax=Actinomycetospora succinea TaxID=663603 RepID=A0A4R6VDS3_9PSEU|nr:hypothetical protein [Actinomycetospora succinea]TDQ58741.1 hypothetical protein EV188_104488 [Actinomycetospora succinea]